MLRAIRVIRFLIFTLAVAIADRCQIVAAEFEVEGQLDIKSLTADDKIRTSGVYGFVVAVSRNRWQVEALYGPNHYEIYSCDGTNVYSYLVDKGGAFAGSYPGSVIRGTYPLLATYYVTVPWYAFAFTPTNRPAVSLEMPVPWYPAGEGFLADTCKLNTKSFNAEPGVCSEISFNFSHARLGQPHTNQVPVLLADGLHFPSPDELKGLIPDGSIMGIYRVLEMTNWGGLVLPKQFELTYYSDHHFTNSGRSRLTIVGSVLRVGSLTSSNFVPQFAGTLGVTDFRIKDLRTLAPAIRYTVVDGKWPDENALRLEGIKAAAAHRTIMIILVALAILSLPVCYVLITKIGSRTRIQEL